MGDNGGEEGRAELQIRGLEDPVLQNGNVSPPRVHQVR